MPMTTEEKIAHINGTMAMENMPLSNAEKNLLQDYCDGKITFEQAKEKIIKQYVKDHG